MIHNGFKRPLFGILISATMALAFPNLAAAQTVPQTASPAPVGMVDRPCPAGSQGRSEAEQAYAHAAVAEGAMDPKALAGYAKHAAEFAKADALRAKNDWPDLCRYSDANAEALKAGGVKVVFLGDSITELWQAAEPELFTHGVVDRGISGQTSSQILLRFYADVVALRPRAVHIMAGTNDVAGNNGPNRPDDFKNNIRAMVAIAKAEHIRVILASIPPAGVLSWRKEINAAPRIVELNAWLAAYAKANRLIYADYHKALAGPDATMKPGISHDGVHPTIAGYRLMHPLTQAAMAKALAGPAR